MFLFAMAALHVGPVAVAERPCGAPGPPRPCGRARCAIVAAAEKVTTTLEAKVSATRKLPPGPLASFLMDGAASDAPLLAAKSYSAPSADGSYDCELSSFDFLSLSVTPLVQIAIERDRVPAGELKVRTTNGRVRINNRVQRSAKLGAVNVVRWAGNADDGWDVQCEIALVLSLVVPGLDYMPGFAQMAWVATAKTILATAAGKTARQLLQSVDETFARYGKSAKR